MIELLVAVLIMGIGVLGVTGLQMISLQNNRDALLRSEAVQLAYGILDRIRVNSAAGAASYGVAMNDDPPGAPNCIANACTPAQMVDFDLAMWKCTLGGHNTHASCNALRAAGTIGAVAVQPGLPDGRGSIAIAVNGMVTVSVEWSDFSGATQTVDIESQG